MPLYEINPLGGCVGCSCISMAKISFPHGPKWLTRGGGWWKPERQAVIKQDTFLNHFSLVDPLLKLDQVLTVSHFIIVHKFFIWKWVLFPLPPPEALRLFSRSQMERPLIVWARCLDCTLVSLLFFWSKYQPPAFFVKLLLQRKTKIWLAASREISFSRYEIFTHPGFLRQQARKQVQLYC